jgi:SET domain
MHLVTGLYSTFGLLALARSRERRRTSSSEPAVLLRKQCRGLSAQVADGDTVASSSSSTMALSSIHDSPSRNSKYEGLLQWLKQYPDAFVSDKMELKPSTRGGGYGTFVSEPVDQGELLFAIPRSACITLSDALNDPNCGPLFQALVEKAGPGGNTVVLAGFIAKERLLSVNPSSLARTSSSSAASGVDSGSRYGPYLETLPWERGVNNQEHILYWSTEQIEQLLTGTMCYGEAVDLRREVALAIQVLDTIIGQPVSKALFPWQRDTSPRQPVEGLPEAVKAAFVCLLTRAFQDEYKDSNDDEEKLVPLLDMLQHSDKPNVSHVMRKDNGMVEVRARQSLQANVELLNQYRSEMEEAMPYHRFFTRFGFVPGLADDVPVETLLREKSSIFFAQQAEV